MAAQHGRKRSNAVTDCTEPGTPGRTRTADTRFRKPLLYPLSYRGPYLECALWRARCKHLLNGKECSPHLVRYLRIAPPAQKGIAVPTTTRCGEKQSGHDTNVFRIHRDSHSRRLSAQSGRAPHRFQVRGHIPGREPSGVHADVTHSRFRPRTVRSPRRERANTER